MVFECTVHLNVKRIRVIYLMKCFSFLPKINDIKDSIKQYTDYVEAGSSRRSYFDEDNERNRNLVDELHFKLRFIEKLESFNDWISDTDGKDANLFAVKLNSFFKEKSKLKDNEYMLTTNGREKDLSQILFDMDALLKKRLEIVFQHVGDFLCESSETKGMPADISARASKKETADIGINCELSVSSVVFFFKLKNKLKFR